MHQFWEKYFDKVLLAGLFCYVFTVWVVYGIPEIRDISRDLIIALIALASGRRQQATTEINTGTVETPSVTTETIADSTVITENLSTSGDSLKQEGEN